MSTLPPKSVSDNSRQHPLETENVLVFNLLSSLDFVKISVLYAEKLAK